MDPAQAGKYGVPGPTLEGYRYPATYVFPMNSSLDAILREKGKHYHYLLSDVLGLVHVLVFALAAGWAAYFASDQRSRSTTPGVEAHDRLSRYRD